MEGSVEVMLIRHTSRSSSSLLLALALTLGGLLVGVMRPALASAGPQLLPNLVADSPDGAEYATDSSTGTNRLLLRFNGYIHNKGPGAVDFRGTRTPPKLSAETEKKVKEAEAGKEGLEPKIEEELAAAPMNAVQRLFTTKVGQEETNIERSHVDEPSGAELIFASADGHHHWHLQHAAKYSLWNSSKSAEVAPAQKVGFCLDDSQHVDPFGPKEKVYADTVPPFREFCQQWHPNATSLFEGISAGWRDLYDRGLAFQWVDVSNVLPGEYWLRADVNPLGVIKEEGGTKAPAYTATTIKGFDALAQATSTGTEEPATVTLASKAWKDSVTPKYAIVSGPQHGTLGAVNNNHVTYTPVAGYSGPDSFTYLASDPNSEFPMSPAVATVSIEVVAPSSSALLVGDATSTYSVPDQTRSGREEAFQFTAKSTGTVKELELRTNTITNPGVTGMILGIFADSAGKPGDVLGQATASGEPATSSWIKATGLSTAVVGGTKYWLVVLPLGAKAALLHFNSAVAGGGGTGNVESTVGGLSALTAEASWETFNEGPMGFQAIGPNANQPSVAIEGAPSSMIAGTSVQLSAVVSDDSPGVIWSVSAGTITPEGLYTAPSEVPAGGTVQISATSTKGAQDQRTITITPIPQPQPAPETTQQQSPTPGQSPPQSGSGATLGESTSFLPSVARPQAMLLGRRLVMTTLANVAGRLRLSAYLGKRLLGTCVVETPAGRRFTCRVTLGAAVSLRARISVLASLRFGATLLRNLRPAAPVPVMKMSSSGALPTHAAASVAWQYWCSPAMRRLIASASFAAEGAGY